MSGKTEEALRRYREAVFAPEEVASEGDLSRRVDTLMLLAEAQGYAGRPEEARETWKKITAMGYERLWRTHHYVLAQKRGAAP